MALSGLPDEAPALLSAFWKEQLREQFPVLQYQAPYEPQVERFPSGPTPSFPLIVAGAQLPASRLWASHRDGQELIQLQREWFACNWRKVKPDDEYDRWSQRRASFVHRYSELLRYLASENVRAVATQCEVSYINHIEPSGSWASHGQVNEVVALGLPHRVATLELEQAALEARYVLRGRDESSIGRVYAKLLPAFARDGRSPLYVLELTARGAPLGGGTEGVLAFLDAGREVIDELFLRLTTDGLQTDWGREVQ